MTIEQLRIFIAVAERLHMTQAAHALHMTQSAASAAIAALEQRHGVRLFNRVGRGLELSEAGRIFLPEARAVLARQQSAEQTLLELAGLKRGRVRVVASQTVANYWLTPHLAAFAHAHPGVELSLRVGNTAQAVRAVLEHDADLGVVEGDVESPHLNRRTVGRDRLSIYAAKNHRITRAAAPSWTDLAREDWVMREAGSGTRADFELALHNHGVDPRQLRVLLELPSNAAMLTTVASGGCLCAVSELAAAPHLAAGQLSRLPIDLAEREFSLIQRDPSRTSPAALAFASRWSNVDASRLRAAAQLR